MIHLHILEYAPIEEIEYPQSLTNVEVESVVLHNMQLKVEVSLRIACTLLFDKSRLLRSLSAMDHLVQSLKKVKSHHYHYYSHGHVHFSLYTIPIG